MKYTAWLFLVIVLSACGGQKNLNSPAEIEITFGSSGGFTNINPEYVIKGNREIVRRDQNTETVLLTLKKKKYREICKQIEALDFEHLKVNDRGNMTYYIAVKTPDYNHTIRWNDSSNQEQIKNFYNILISSLK